MSESQIPRTFQEVRVGANFSYQGYEMVKADSLHGSILGDGLKTRPVAIKPEADVNNPEDQ